MKERILEYFDEWKWYVTNLNPFEKIMVGLLGLMFGLLLLIIF